MPRKLKNKVPVRNQSHYGWWVASYIEKAVWDGRKKQAIKRHRVWENTIILKAKNRDAAYAKATKLGKLSRSTFTNDKTGEKGRWEFAGLTNLLPIYEPLGDGAEIFWDDLGERNPNFVSSRVKRKKQLSVFDDSDM